MQMSPLVSIVMCAWNPRPDWLRAAVGSVLAQEDVDVELVLVDDGSPEPVAELIADIRDPRIRRVRVDHGGAAHARNAGTKHARGAYVRFADADDVLEARSCSRLLRLSAPDGAIAYGGTAVCDEQLRPSAVKTSTLSGWIVRECLLYRFDVRHMSMLFPRSVVDAVGGWEPTLAQCEDWDYVLRALEHAPVRGEREVATFYRRHPGALTANVAGSLDHESIVVDRYFERHPEQVGTTLEREARAKLLLVRAHAHASLAMGRRARARLVRDAFVLHPIRTAEDLAVEGIRLGKRSARRALAALRL